MSIERVHAFFFRGLNPGQIERITKRLPDTHTFRSSVLDYSPSFIAMKCEPGSGRDALPVAGVCLQDVSVALMEARYGLMQALVSLEFWTDIPGYEQVRVGKAQYYVADVANRVYAAGEHLAAAIMNMLDIAEAALGGSKHTSRQMKLLEYLKAHHPEHPATVAVRPLGRSAPFKRTLNYRGDWVHDQPTRVQGLGITYSRDASRWREIRNDQGEVIGHGLSAGGGDPTSQSIETIIEDALAAVQAVTAAAQGAMDVYDAVLAACGVRVNHSEGKVEVGVFDGE